MKVAATGIAGLGLAACAAIPAQGSLPAPLVVESPHGFETTVARLDAAVAVRPLKVFAVIDHAGGAATIGETLAPSRLLVFGNPQAGTPFMQANPAFGQELPLKILVYRDGETTRLAYPDIAALSDAYGISPDDAPVEQVVATLDAIVREATGG